MSQPAIAVEPTSRTVAILGADALLVALPSTPTQLANACFSGGFAEVFPATWGDELIAAGCLEQLESRSGPAIFCACPLVAEQLRGAAELRRFIIPLISPPVAVARYLRALYPGDALRITYVGDCPGADDESIDERLSPHELLEHLAKRGILPATQRPDLGTHAARDRRRFYSLPGGVPAPQWLSAQWPKRTLVDVHAGDALASLANQTLSRGNTLIDFAPHLGCACAGAVGGTSAQDARKGVVALEPPRAQSEIVSSAVRVEVSLAPAGEHHLAEVSWNDFLAALPAALAMPADGAHPAQPPASRTEPRRIRGREKKVALPRAYLAARQGARRDRTGPTRARATVAPARATRGLDAGSRPIREAMPDADASRRDDGASPRPNAWVARRASQEGMTGPRNQPQRAGLATADRWLLAGLMLAASVLVAVLTSALTVSGMQRDSALAVASAPPATAPAPAPVPIAQPARAADSVLVAATTRGADSAPQHEDAGTVGTPPSTAPRVSPAPQHSAHSVRSTRREAIRPERRPLSVADRPRIVPPALASPSSIVQTTRSVSPPVTQPVAQPAAQPATIAVAPPAVTSTAANTPPATQPAATTVTNAQFLEELRAIHAEIDARKRHMDSLTRSLDSLKKISPPG
jgi:hypothetical protein